MTPGGDWYVEWTTPMMRDSRRGGERYWLQSVEHSLGSDESITVPIERALELAKDLRHRDVRNGVWPKISYRLRNKVSGQYIIL